MNKNLTITFDTKELSEKLSQLLFHVKEAKKVINSINSMKGTDLVARQGNDTKKKSRTAEQANDALCQLVSGEMSINEIRKEFRLLAIKEDQFNKKFIEAKVNLERTTGKCSYLGCNCEETFFDDVLVAPNTVEKKPVCIEHLGQLRQEVIVQGIV